MRTYYIEGHTIDIDEETVRDYEEVMKSPLRENAVAIHMLILLNHGAPVDDDERLSRLVCEDIRSEFDKISYIPAEVLKNV